MILRRLPVAVSTIQKSRRAFGTRRGGSVLASIFGRGRGGGSTQDSSSAPATGVGTGLSEGVEVGVDVLVGRRIGVGDGGSEDGVGVEKGVLVAVGEGADTVLHAVSNASAMMDQRRLCITSQLLR